MTMFMGAAILTDDVSIEYSVTDSCINLITMKLFSNSFTLLQIFADNDKKCSVDKKTHLSCIELQVVLCRSILFLWNRL